MTNIPGIIYPTPNISTGWGGTLNDNFAAIDDIFAANGTGTPLGFNVGSGKTLTLGGKMVIGSGDGGSSALTVETPAIRGAARTGTNATVPDLTIDACNGTGTFGSGKIVFRTVPAGSSGSSAGTFAAALTIGKSSDTALIDVGAGGTLATNAASTLRINGSNAGAGTEGGSALYISNNGTNAGAFGNRSTIYGGATAYNAAATLWGSASLSFVVGSGTLAASNEKMKIGSAGQLYFWDTTLATPALNPGSAGQVLTSNGASDEPTWQNRTINVITAVTPTSTKAEITGIPSTAKTITISVNALDGSGDALVQLGTSGSYATSGYTSTGSIIGTSGNTATSSTGFVLNLGGNTASGTIRLTNVTGNVWVCDHTLGGGSYSFAGGGVVTLSGALTRVQIVPSTGTFATTGKVGAVYL